jgi:hypothetical protein
MRTRRDPQDAPLRAEATYRKPAEHVVYSTSIWTYFPMPVAIPSSLAVFRPSQNGSSALEVDRI